MKKLIVLSLSFGCFWLVPAVHAMDLKQSKFTQVVNEVQVISPADNSQKPAAVNDIFATPDLVRTGPASRAELVAADDTITRVGANTVFSFDPANRTIDLQQGSLLFHSPHGKGGGTIRTGSATASVLGTTIIVTTTPSGGFKLIDLEGHAEIKFLNGLQEHLDPGQMTFILPGGQPSPIIIIRLGDLTKGSQLVQGFGQALPSLPLIEQQVANQVKLIQSGQAQDTGLVVGNDATPTTVQGFIDPNTITAGQKSSTTPNPAFNSDASIVGPNPVSGLPVNYPPLDPNHVVSGSFIIPDVDSFSQGLLFLGISAPAAGFLGNNIDLDTCSIDLSSFAGESDFEIMAAKDLRIWRSVNFTPGSGQPDTIGLLAGGRLSIAPHSTLTADTVEFGLAADSFNTLNTEDGSVLDQNKLDGVRFQNNAGDIDIFSIQDLTLFDDSSICANGVVDIESQSGTLTFGSDEDANIHAGGSVFLSGNNGVNVSGKISGGTLVNISSVSGPVSINNSRICSRNTATVSGVVNVNAGTDIGISGTTINAATINVTAKGDVTADTDTFNAQSLNVTAGGSINAYPGGNDQVGSVTLTAGDGILIDGQDSSPTVVKKFFKGALKLFSKSQKPEPTPSAGRGETSGVGTLQATAANLIQVQNICMSMATVNLAANTINLLNVAFGCTTIVNLQSLDGVLAPNPNTGAASVPGDVNFISNVTYGGNPAQNYIGNGINISALQANSAARSGAASMPGGVAFGANAAQNLIGNGFRR